MKILLSIIIVFWTLVVVAQPAATYTIKPGTTLSVSGDYSGAAYCISGDCPPCTTSGGEYWAFGFTSPNGTEYWPSTTNGGFGNNVTVNVTTGTPGSTQVWKYRRRKMNQRKPCSTCSCVGTQATGSFEEVKEVRITTVEDLIANGTVPSVLCNTQGQINLYALVNKSSGVVFKDGETVITSSFDPSSASPGSHTLTASYTFSNGATTVQLGTTIVQQEVTITANPANATLCPGTGATFTASGTGTGLAYQWQESLNNGGSFSSLSNAAVYSGVTTSTLTISNVTGMQGRIYRLQVNGSCGTKYSGQATLSVTPGPAITSDPAAANVCASGNVTFSVTATGTGLTYQWQRSETGGTGSYANINNATGTSYVITSATTSGYYRAVVRNTCGSEVVSGAAQLTVRPVTSITHQPENVSICPGETGTFLLTSSGSGTLTYQWQYSIDGGATYSDIGNSSTYTGATTASLKVVGGNPFLNGNAYRCRVVGACGTVTTNRATLTINPIPQKPEVVNPTRCGDGTLAATATSTAPSPGFSWFINAADNTPVYTGATYEISNLTVSTDYFVSVTSLGCTSEKQRVSFGHRPMHGVTLGSDLVLCVGQGVYNLEKDISDPAARGADFTWTANNVQFSARTFDPSVGAGVYTVTYDPPVSAKAYPNCFITTTRKVSVINAAGESGLAFEGESVSNGNTLNLCVGDDPINLVSFPSVAGGTWTTVEGQGLSFSGNAVIFTPDRRSFTDIEANVFRYAVSVNGCTAQKDLNIYVKDNPNVPVVTGVPVVICPGKALNLSASVTVPGTYDFEWYHAGEDTPFTKGSTQSYTVSGQETLWVRSVNGSFGCRSESALVTINTPFSTRSVTASKTSISLGDAVSFSSDASESGNSFLWNFGDGATSTERSPVHYFYSPGEFTVRLDINSNLGCSQTISFEKITVSGEPVNIVTGLPAGEAVTIDVFPNPFTGWFRIESSTKVLRWSLTDMMGKVIRTQKGEQTFIDAEALRPGSYLLRVELPHAVSQLRITKQ